MYMYWHTCYWLWQCSKTCLHAVSNTLIGLGCVNNKLDYNYEWVQMNLHAPPWWYHWYMCTVLSILAIKCNIIIKLIRCKGYTKVHYNNYNIMPLVKRSSEHKRIARLTSMHILYLGWFARLDNLLSVCPAGCRHSSLKQFLWVQVTYLSTIIICVQSARKCYHAHFWIHSPHFGFNTWC